jgi:hypothetical protein
MMRRLFLLVFLITGTVYGQSIGKEGLLMPNQQTVIAGKDASGNVKVPVVSADGTLNTTAIGYVVILSANFTRPADTTAYASGDLVANSVTAGSVVPMTFAASRTANTTGMIRRVRLKTSSTSVTAASFRVHFYRNSPTVTNGDNGAWLSIEASYIGSCDVTVDKAFSDAADGIGVSLIGQELNFVPAAGTQNIFALIEARAAYTPTSAEVFTLTIEVWQN